AQTTYEKKVFDVLCADGTAPAVLAVLRQISREEVSVHIAALQAAVWNQTVRLALPRYWTGNFWVAGGRCGDYVFPAGVCPAFAGMDIPTAAARLTMPDVFWKNCYEDALTAEGISTVLFRRWKLRQGYFSSTPRPLVVVPEHLYWEKQHDNGGQLLSSLRLSFVLQPGAYATMFLKNLSARQRRSS
ncbi:MAG: hypothetical protein NC924_05375, partial [Candidatus Omnitrophica bacterium]|nr:hypothetical protein [Candidatus Omnitrophota bacterium]